MMGMQGLGSNGLGMNTASSSISPSLLLALMGGNSGNNGMSGSGNMAPTLTSPTMRTGGMNPVTQQQPTQPVNLNQGGGGAGQNPMQNLSSMLSLLRGAQGNGQNGLTPAATNMSAGNMGSLLTSNPYTAGIGQAMSNSPYAAANNTTGQMMSMNNPTMWQSLMKMFGGGGS